MSETNKKKRGRPKKGGSKQKQYRLRMTEEEFNEFTRLSELSHKSKSDILREGYQMSKNLILSANGLTEKDLQNDDNDYVYDDYYYEEESDDEEID